MPSIRKRPPFAANEIVIAINTGACALPDGSDGYFVAGRRYRGSDAIVDLNPAFFVRDGLTDAEIDAARRELHVTHYSTAVPADAPIIRKAIERRLRDADAVVATDLAPFRAGTRLAKNDLRVKDAPAGAFVDVLPSGARRDDCYLATQTLRHRDGFNVEHITWAGTLVPKTDPAVERHPLLFTLPTPEAD